MVCAHCGITVTEDAPTTADFEKVCEECASLARDTTERDEDGDPINETTPTDVPPVA